MIQLLKGFNIKIIKQLINYNTQTIGIIIDINKLKVFIPVKPSNIKNNINYEFFENSYNGISYQKTILAYKLLLAKTNNKLRLNIRSLVLENNMVVGLVTETNQFVPILPEIYDEVLMNKDGEKEVIDTGNEYILDDKILNDTTVDNDRKEMVKKVELESSFFLAFRNNLKILIKNSENETFKKELINIINKNEPYVLKLKKTVIKLRFILKDTVQFIEFANNNDLLQLEQLYNCIGLDGEQCSKNSNCMFDETTCKLILPRYNLISNEDNISVYYYRLADELIRYPKVKEYILHSDKFLMISETNYNLKDSEILLIEENLFGNYLRNLTIRKINKYIKFNSNYDYAIPKQKNIYNFTKSNKKLMEKYSGEQFEVEELDEKVNQNNIKNVDVNDVINEKNNQDLLTDCINTASNTINISNYNIELNKNNSIIELNRLYNCSVKFMSYLITLHDNIIFKESDVKNKLIEIMTGLSQVQKNNKVLQESFKLSNKLELYNIYNNKDDIELVINHPLFYLTEMEIILLAFHYNINIVLISNSFSFINGKNVIKLNIESDKSDLFLIDNYYTFKLKDNKYENSVPSYGIIQENGLTFMKTENVDKIIKYDENKIFVVNSIEDLIDKYYNYFVLLKKLETISRKKSQKSISFRKQQSAGFKIVKTNKKITIK